MYFKTHRKFVWKWKEIVVHCTKRKLSSKSSLNWSTWARWPPNSSHIPNASSLTEHIFFWLQWLYFWGKSNIAISWVGPKNVPGHKNRFVNIPWFCVLRKEIRATANLHPGGCVLLNVKVENHIEKKTLGTQKGWKPILIVIIAVGCHKQTNKYNIVSPCLVWCGRGGGCNKKEGPKGLHVVWWFEQLCLLVLQLAFYTQTLLLSCQRLLDSNELLMEFSGVDVLLNHTQR